MNKGVPRLRMFAGPNGSGKSTFKSIIRPELLGIYINPDEIEKEICDRGFLDLQDYQVTTTAKEVIDFFIHSPLLKAADLLDDVHSLRFNDEKLSFHNVRDSNSALFDQISPLSYVRKTLHAVLCAESKFKTSLRLSGLHGYEPCF